MVACQFSDALLLLWLDSCMLYAFQHVYSDGRLAEVAKIELRPDDGSAAIIISIGFVLSIPMQFYKFYFAC